MRLETAQTVAPVGTISWLGMAFSCALEKLIDLRVMESYCLLICVAFGCRTQVAMWHSEACLSTSQNAGAEHSTWHQYYARNVG